MILKRLIQVLISCFRVVRTLSIFDGFCRYVFLSVHFWIGLAVLNWTVPTLLPLSLLQLSVARQMPLLLMRWHYSYGFSQEFEVLWVCEKWQKWSSFFLILPLFWIFAYLLEYIGLGSFSRLRSLGGFSRLDVKLIGNYERVLGFVSNARLFDCWRLNLRIINVILNSLIVAASTEDGADCVYLFALSWVYLGWLVVLEHHFYQLVFVQQTKLLWR